MEQSNDQVLEQSNDQVMEQSNDQVMEQPNDQVLEQSIESMELYNKKYIEQSSDRNDFQHQALNDIDMETHNSRRAFDIIEQQITIMIPPLTTMEADTSPLTAMEVDTPPPTPMQVDSPCRYEPSYYLLYIFCCIKIAKDVIITNCTITTHINATEDITTKDIITTYYTITTYTETIKGTVSICDSVTTIV
ncbi:hypothetical protein RFI_28206 [Reticulomyxa filosa]|uniref:Uncharacterized protein n=1 Tax=Reticulomyxa filosa TaxID=46433 RepID=X6M6B3_RETFI|nr:hypothetical protein RFI_28206 [Reticulomyxa filosa]|eukprot:ETO09181.1 hypothetical protein RFI_28206 [Reticulomyxa filosa]